MVLQLMPSGDLKKFLTTRRTTFDLDDDNLYTIVENIEGALSSRELLDICRQVASGMALLSDCKVRQKRELKLCFVFAVQQNHSVAVRLIDADCSS